MRPHKTEYNLNADFWKLYWSRKTARCCINTICYLVSIILIAINEKADILCPSLTFPRLCKCCFKMFLIF